MIAWTVMPDVLLAVALGAYVIGVLLATWATFHRAAAIREGASVVFVAGWLAHAGAVAQRGVSTGSFPLSNRAEYLMVLGLAVMSMQLVVWFRWRIDVAGIVLPPLAALSGFAALALRSPGTAPRPTGPRGVFLFHTTVSTLGMATLLVALVMSAIYLCKDRALKTRRALRLLERLPPLDRCDQVGFQALLVGFILLTLGISAGLVINAGLHHRVLVWELKQTLPLLAWLVLAAILGARLELGFRGRRSAYLTITGVALGLLTVVGMTW
jgi:ABC-type uncharacterized transport system permease subunit